MAHFYRKLLEDSEQQHEEAVAATETKRVLGPQAPAPNLTITKPPELTSKTDLELARLAREEGKDVELNDDNQIVDKRELLSAGLNLSAPNTRRLGLQVQKQASSTSEVQAHRAVGTAASRKEINERRAREIKQQLEEERERTVKQKEANEQEARQRTILKRNTEDDVQDIRARYLERKRRKLEEVAATSESDDPTSRV